MKVRPRSLLKSAARTSTVMPLFRRSSRAVRASISCARIGLSRNAASVVSAPCGSTADIEAAFAARSRESGGGVIGIADTFITEHRDLIIALAARYRLPAIYGNRIFVPLGGLLAYSADFPDIFHRAAGYVDRILRGARPGELPVQAPAKFTLSVNLKAARAIGLALPEALIARADEVIE